MERHFQHMIGQIRESINRLTLNNSDGSYEQLLGEKMSKSMFESIHVCVCVCVCVCADGWKWLYL